MNAPEKVFLPDIQASADNRQLPIGRVAVRGLRLPLSLIDGDGAVRHTVATLEMTVGLGTELKGTHMSRFVEVPETEREALDLVGLREMFAARLQRLDARIERWTVASENFESIHKHSAYALFEGVNPIA